MSRPVHARRLLSCALALLACLVLIASLLRLTPPAVMPAGFTTLRLVDFPPGTERVELEVEPGVSLVGVFVPAGDGAPVVVHLPPAMDSITHGSRSVAVLEVDAEGRVEGRMALGRFSVTADIRGLSPMATGDGEPLVLELAYRLPLQLRQLGFASLIVDYTGVGASGGRSSPDHLARDAHRIYAEALRRAGGDPRMVVLRGVSLGALAIASLLADGVRPAAVVLVAPVRGETVVAHATRFSLGTVLGALASLPFGPVGDADLLAALDTLAAPLLVVVPHEDAFIGGDEQARMRQVVEGRGGAWRVHGRGHELLGIEARGLMPGEASFLIRSVPLLEASLAARSLRLIRALTEDGRVGPRLPPDGARRGRLERLSTGYWPSPRVALLLALARDGEVQAEALRPWLDWLPPDRLDPLPWPALQALLDLDDPLVPLEPDWLAQLSASVAPLVDPASGLDDPGELLREIADPDSGSLFAGSAEFGANALRPTDVVQPISGTLYDFANRRQSEDGLSQEQREHLMRRLALRLAAIPDRVRSIDGDLVHEVWHDGDWQRLDPAP